MSAGITTAAILGASAISAGAGITSAVLGSRAASSAAQTQSNAADVIRQQAIDAATKASGVVNDATTDANKTLTDAQQQRLDALAPYIKAGTVSMDQVMNLLSDDGPLGKGGDFSFTAKDWENNPQYAFEKQQLQQATERSAAAGGGLLTGGFVKGLNRYQTGLVDSTMNSAFNRALDTYNTNRQNTITRLQGYQSMTGLGYNATQLQDGVIGGTANTIASNKINAGMYTGTTGIDAARIGAEAIGAKADAQAAGDVAKANAINNGISTGVNGLNTGLLYMMPQVASPTITRTTPTTTTTTGPSLGLYPPVLASATGQVPGK